MLLSQNNCASQLYTNSNIYLPKPQIAEHGTGGPKPNFSKNSNSSLTTSKSNTSEDTITNNDQYVPESNSTCAKKETKSSFRGFLKRMLIGRKVKIVPTRQHMSRKQVEYSQDISLKDEDVRQLLLYYSECPNLYNPKNSQYGNREIEEICYENLTTHFPNHTSEELKRYLNNLRQQFEREYSIIEIARLRYGKTITPTNKYFDEFQFLVPYVDIQFDSISKSQIETGSIDALQSIIHKRSTATPRSDVMHSSIARISTGAKESSDGRQLQDATQSSASECSSNGTQSLTVKCSSDATRLSYSAHLPVAKLSSDASHLSSNIPLPALKSSSLKQKSTKNLISGQNKSIDITSILTVPQLGLCGRKKKSSVDNLVQGDAKDKKIDSKDADKGQKKDNKQEEQKSDHQFEQQQANTQKNSEQEQAGTQSNTEQQPELSKSTEHNQNDNSQANGYEYESEKNLACCSGNCPYIPASQVGTPEAERSYRTQIIQDKRLGCVAIIQLGNRQTNCPSQSSRNNRVANGAHNSQQGMSSSSENRSPQRNIQQKDSRTQGTISKTQHPCNRPTVGNNDKQVQLLCDMIRAELSSAPEQLYYDAKWRIIEILREVGKRNLTNKSGTQQSRARNCVDICQNTNQRSLPPTSSDGTNKLARLHTNCPYCCNTNRFA